VNLPGRSLRTVFSSTRAVTLPASRPEPPHRGRYESHYLKGWPEAEAFGLTKCDEHGDHCAKRVTFIDVPIVRHVLFDGGGPYYELG